MKARHLLFGVVVVVLGGVLLTPSVTFSQRYPDHPITSTLRGVAKGLLV